MCHSGQGECQNKCTLSVLKLLELFLLMSAFDIKNSKLNGSFLIASIEATVQHPTTFIHVSSCFSCLAWMEKGQVSLRIKKKKKKFKVCICIGTSFGFKEAGFQSSALGVISDQINLENIENQMAFLKQLLLFYCSRSWELNIEKREPWGLCCFLVRDTYEVLHLQNQLPLEVTRQQCPTLLIYSSNEYFEDLITVSCV